MRKKEVSRSWASLKRALNGRGFTFKTNQCRNPHCQCTGKHYSISGNGILKNNLSINDIEQIIRDYPVL